MIATLTQADVVEFDKLDSEVLGKLTTWIGCLEELLNWLVGEWNDSPNIKERAEEVNAFLDTGFFEE